MLILENIGQAVVSRATLSVPPTIKEAIKQIDDDPFFVVLPVARVDAVSRNGRKYPRDAVQQIVASINAGKVNGIKGHLTATERSHRFDVPSLYWLAAELADDIVYALAYVPKSLKDVREHLLVSIALNRTVATSLYGTANHAEDGTVYDLDVEQIDLVDHHRAGVADAVAVPTVAESYEPNADDEQQFWFIPPGDTTSTSRDDEQQWWFIPPGDDSTSTSTSTSTDDDEGWLIP